MISPRNWKRWFSFLVPSQSRPVTRRTRLLVEQLEDRWVPSSVLPPTVDLTTAGSIGQINGAIFRQADHQPSGSGVIDSFVRLKAPGNSTIEQGYNTDFRPLQFDENNSPQFTRSLLLSSVPTVTIGGVPYREFLLDINQKSSDPLLSLDELRFYTAGRGDLHNYNTTTNTLDGHTARYDMGPPDNWVKLNARLSHGSGSSDMLLDVPAADFTGVDGYVYLYSKFGVHVDCNGGYEEWAVGAHGNAVTSDNTGSISGFVLNDANHSGIGGVTVTLTLTSIQGAPITFTAITAPDGSYSFTHLLSGIYSDSAGQASGFQFHTASVGTGMDSPSDDGMVSSNHTITNIILDSDDVGINYDFSELPVAQQTYSIGGTVNEPAGAGAYTVILTDTTTGATQTFTASAASPYSFTGLAAGHNYTVTLTPPIGYTVVNPPTDLYMNNNLMSNVTNDNFTIRTL